MRTERTSRAPGVIFIWTGAVLWLLLAAAAQGQLPDKFRNLQLLPKTSRRPNSPKP
jgi:hypothetical protein